MLKSHELIDGVSFRTIRYELRPAVDLDGQTAAGLHHAWILLNNPAELNSYTTEMVKEVILAFRRASADRSVVSVVFTAVGDRAFSTGGNTREYAEYYTGHPLEYLQYMGLFIDMVDSILECDHPVINRVNGIRVAGGQEIGMACDFTIAADTAVFGQAGPKHGSAPDGGSTDFLPGFVCLSRAMESATLCETWTAHEALRFGLINEIVPVLKLNGKFISNPLVIADRWLDEYGRIVHGRRKSGAELEVAKGLRADAIVDFTLLDQAVERLGAKLMATMPGCLMKTIEGIRRHKMSIWDAHKHTNRQWLALNMTTEGKAGFRAFNAGGDRREVDFVRLRQLLAAGHSWDDALIREISPAPDKVKA